MNIAGSSSIRAIEPTTALSPSSETRYVCSERPSRTKTATHDRLVAKAMQTYKKSVPAKRYAAAYKDQEYAGKPPIYCHYFGECRANGMSVMQSHKEAERLSRAYKSAKKDKNITDVQLRSVYAQTYNYMISKNYSDERAIDFASSRVDSVRAPQSEVYNDIYQQHRTDGYSLIYSHNYASFRAAGQSPQQASDSVRAWYRGEPVYL